MSLQVFCPITSNIKTKNNCGSGSFIKEKQKRDWDRTHGDGNGNGENERERIEGASPFPSLRNEN